MLWQLMVAATITSVQPTPNSELRAAVECALTQGHYAKQARFLTFYHLPKDQWQSMRESISLAANTISRANAIHNFRIVPQSDSMVALYWQDDYGLPLEGWEAIASGDPYFHITSEVLDPKTGKKRKVYTDGGWMDLGLAAQLRSLTGSGGALLRADYFLSKTITTLNGGLYYELAGIPETRDEFYKLLRIDRKEIASLAGTAITGANMYRSGVTKRPRRVVRRQGSIGAAWETFDVAVPSPDKDPFRSPFEFKFDASEAIASKPNGLHYFALFNEAGKRQATVPDNIAKDHRDTLGPGILVPPISCMRCHDTSGLLDVPNDQKKLLDGPVDLAIEGKRNADKAKAFYDSPRANVYIQRDREDYELSVKEISDKPVGELSNRMAALHDTFAYADVTAEVAARELGVSVEEFRLRMKRANDPGILSLLVGIGIQRPQWESAFPEAAVLAASGQRRAK